MLLIQINTWCCQQLFIQVNAKTLWHQYFSLIYFISILMANWLYPSCWFIHIRECIWLLQISGPRHSFNITKTMVHDTKLCLINWKKQLFLNFFFSGIVKNDMHLYLYAYDVQVLEMHMCYWFVLRIIVAHETDIPKKGNSQLFHSLNITGLLWNWIR